MKVLSLNHASIDVANVERSVYFYKEILGMEVIDISLREPPFSELATGIKDIRLKIAYLRIGNFKLELIQYLGGISLSRETLRSNHICLNVVGIQSFYEAHKNDVKFIGKPIKIPKGPNRDGYMVYFYDPDMNKIELIETPAKPNAE